MRNKSTEEKYLNVLQAISQRQRGFRDIRQFLSKFKVSVSMQQVLTKKNLVVKDDNGIWKWSSKMPDMKMANEVLNAVNSGIRNSNNSAKKRNIEAKDIFSPGNRLSNGKSITQSKISKIMNTTISAKQTKRQKAEEKYLNFLNFLYTRNRGFASFSKIIKNHKMCSSISGVLKLNGLMEKQNDGMWRWIGKTPDIAMASAILDEINQSILMCIDKKNDSKKKNNGFIKNNKKSLKNILGVKPKVVVHKYVPRTSNNVLNLEDLRNEREKLQARINTIDNVLITIDILNKK